MTPEGRVKAKVKKALDKLGTDCWRFMPVQTGFGSPALDFLLSIRGRFVAIETKAPGKVLTPLQEQTKAAIEAAGGIVLVVWDESSLAIAMKIILALEFTPHDGQDRRSDCLKVVFTKEQRNPGGPGGGLIARRTASAEAWPEIQHEGAVEPAQAADAAAGGDHGAPGASPKRRSKPAAGGDNQRVTATVNDERLHDPTKPYDPNLNPH